MGSAASGLVSLYHGRLGDDRRLSPFFLVNGLKTSAPTFGVIEGVAEAFADSINSIIAEATHG